MNSTSVGDEPLGAHALTSLARLEPDLVTLTRELIRAPSENPPGDERAVVAVARAALEHVTTVDVDIVAPPADHTRESVIATAGPADAPSMLFAAHLDTVPRGAGWSRDPFGGEMHRSAIYGRGATDNKGAAAAMIVAFQALVEAGVTTNRRLVLVANADEEAGGEHGINYVRDLLDCRIDFAIVAEPCGIENPFETLYVAARGASRFTISAKGTATHTSLARHDGVVNAVDRIMAAIGALRERPSVLHRHHPTYGPMADLIVVRVDGGTGWGVVPGLAKADIELRVAPGCNRDDVELALQAAAADIGVDLWFAEGSRRWVAPSEVPLGHPLVEAVRSAWRDELGSDPPMGCFPGGTDGCSLSERGIPTLPALGPGALLRAHGPDEYVTVDELRTAARLYIRIALKALRPQ